MFLSADAIYADIETIGSESYVQYVQTTVDDFIGTLITRRLTQITTGSLGMDIAGDLDADLIVSDRITRPIDITGSLPADRSIVMGGRLADTGSITMAANGLKGQIIINAVDDSFQWLGDITIGATTLSGPRYTNTSASLGGGSVGIVPFDFHKADSNPDYDSSTFASSSSPPTLVEIFHYGPVRFDLTGGGTPFTVERRPITNPPGSWVDVTNSYSYAIDGSDSRIVEVTGTFDGSLEYRIIPVSGKALCDDLLTGSDVDIDYSEQDGENAFRFKVYTFDFFEMSGDDKLDQDDLDEWDKAPKDFNADGSANQADRDLLAQAIGS